MQSYFAMQGVGQSDACQDIAITLKMTVQGF
jgi:hypothetical protein